MNDYRKILEEKAKIGLEELKQFIEQDNNLLYETEEEENFITINIFMFDENLSSEDSIGFQMIINVEDV